MKEKHRILLKRLDRPEYQTGETLADFMGISSKTVRLLIREINEELEGAAIVSRRRVGYRLEISDRDRFERFIGKTRDRQLPATPQERIAYILEVLLKERQFIKLDDLSERLYISKKTLSRELKEVEARLTAYGLRLVRRPGYGIAAEENDNIVIDSSTSGLAVRMLELVKSAFSYDFLEDLELRMALCQHLLPLKVRMGCGLSMKNPLLKEIREKYPLAYAMAAHATIAVEQEYGGRMADDEIGYIALLFALALERRRTEIAKKNILLVCASGHGTAELMKYKYRQEFGRYLQHVETCDVNQLETINFDCFDYVFTTVPIRIPVPIPIEKVGSFLEEGEIRRIRKMLGPKQRRRIRGYYPEALFFPGLEADAKEEALRRMCARMTEVCGLAPEFYESVCKRERLAQTAFGNLVALPHSYEAMSERTYACVAVLKEPILWDGQPVQAVFLLSIEKKKNKELQHFFQVTMRFLSDRTKIQGLIRRRDYAWLMEMLEKIEDGIIEEEQKSE